ncbi:MAG: peptide chain release factor N(5)-glutamine methyltransferase [Dysgonamonadaceae bacterium]|jgi:release factor glutamine methyltransferase|nr:peptide chain release factor N(5)-glutamine methyltransferase [Dysgonamonadaceae bacterium]
MQQTLQCIQQRLQGLYPASEIKSFAYLILEFVCKKDKQVLLRDKDNQLSPNELIRIQEIVEELKKFRPVQYILGETEFYGLKFKVNEHVLIPRPETEELVDWIISSASKLSPQERRILDIGTGSGCIAVALAKHIPDASVYALDISEKALEVALQNTQINGVTVSFFQRDIFENNPLAGLRSPFSIIVSNPPYIVPSEKQQMSPNVLNYEPHQALFVPENQPLLFYEQIADLGLEHLEKNGSLFFETGSLFGKTVAEMMRKKGYKPVKLLKDISGKDRMVKGQLGENKNYVYTAG